MGGKNSYPDPPDYTALAAANKKSAEYSFRMGKAQLAWAKKQYGKDSKIINRVVDAALQRADENDRAALQDRRRYERIYQPLEQDLIRESKDFASPQRQRYEAGRASADVAQQFDQQRRAAAKNLEAYGVDPTSTRYAALDMGSRIAQAAAQAGAANQARVQTENMGRAMRSEAINIGRGYPGQIAGTYGTALQSGSQAANSTLANTASGASTMGTGTQWTGIGQQGINSAANIINTGYNNALQAAQLENQSSSGLGGLLGAGLGFMQGAGFAFSEGGAVPDVTSGGSVPAAASPTRGRAIDDVPARLNAGEFVVPKDAVSWYGERHFQQLIEKGRKEREAAPAKPEFAIAPPAPATFASGASAIPMG